MKHLPPGQACRFLRTCDSSCGVACAINACTSGRGRLLVRMPASLQEALAIYQRIGSPFTARVRQALHDQEASTLSELDQYPAEVLEAVLGILRARREPERTKT